MNNSPSLIPMLFFGAVLGIAVVAFVAVKYWWLVLLAIVCVAYRRATT